MAYPSLRISNGPKGRRLSWEAVSTDGGLLKSMTKLQSVIVAHVGSLTQPARKQIERDAGKQQIETKEDAIMSVIGHQ